jgi:hypothetical protein
LTERGISEPLLSAPRLISCRDQGSARLIELGEQVTRARSTAQAKLHALTERERDRDPVFISKAERPALASA